MMPVNAGPVLNTIVHAYGLEETTLDVELRISQSPTNHTPKIILAKKSIPISKGHNSLEINWENIKIDTPQYFMNIFE